jgi:hypothetical protein
MRIAGGLCCLGINRGERNNARPRGDGGARVSHAQLCWAPITKLVKHIAGLYKKDASQTTADEITITHHIQDDDNDRKGKNFSRESSARSSLLVSSRSTSSFSSHRNSIDEQRPPTYSAIDTEIVDASAINSEEDADIAPDYAPYGTTTGRILGLEQQAHYDPKRTRNMLRDTDNLHNVTPIKRLMGHYSVHPPGERAIKLSALLEALPVDQRRVSTNDLPVKPAVKHAFSPQDMEEAFDKLNDDMQESILGEVEQTTIATNIMRAYPYLSKWPPGMGMSNHPAVHKALQWLEKDIDNHLDFIIKMYGKAKPGAEDLRDENSVSRKLYRLVGSKVADPSEKGFEAGIALLPHMLKLKAHGEIDEFIIRVKYGSYGVSIPRYIDMVAPMFKAIKNEAALISSLGATEPQLSFLAKVCVHIKDLQSVFDKSREAQLSLVKICVATLNKLVNMETKRNKETTELCNTKYALFRIVQRIARQWGQKPQSIAEKLKEKEECLNTFVALFDGVTTLSKDPYFDCDPTRTVIKELRSVSHEMDQLPMWS